MISKIGQWLNDHDNQPWSVIVHTHIIGIIAVWYLIENFSWWMIPGIWMGWFLIGGIGVEIGMHRLFSHRAFELGPLRWAVGWLACLSLQDSPLFWAALHRGIHHPKTDQPEDVHSPIHGYWSAYMGWMFKQNGIARRMNVVRDLIRDPMHGFLHRNYFLIHFGSFVTGLYLFGPNVLIFMVIPALLALHQENIVNLCCHLPCFGYRNFDTKDESRNILVLGWALWGQGFHNNHHALPRAYDFGAKWYEIDICRWIVPALIWADRRIQRCVSKIR